MTREVSYSQRPMLAWYRIAWLTREVSYSQRPMLAWYRRGHSRAALWALGLAPRSWATNTAPVEAKYLCKSKVTYGTCSLVPAGKDGFKEFLQGGRTGAWTTIYKQLLGWVEGHPKIKKGVGGDLNMQL